MQEIFPLFAHIQGMLWEDPWAQLLLLGCPSIKEGLEEECQLFTLVTCARVLAVGYV